MQQRTAGPRPGLGRGSCSRGLANQSAGHPRGKWEAPLQGVGLLVRGALLVGPCAFVVAFVWPRKAACCPSPCDRPNLCCCRSQPAPPPVPSNPPPRGPPFRHPQQLDRSGPATMRAFLSTPSPAVHSLGCVDDAVMAAARRESCFGFVCRLAGVWDAPILHTVGSHQSMAVQGQGRRHDVCVSPKLRRRRLQGRCPAARGGSSGAPPRRAGADAAAAPDAAGGCEQHHRAPEPG